MFQAQKYIEQIQSLAHGTARLEAMNEAIEAADQASEHYWRIYFRYEYIKESVFHDDNFKAVIMFPNLLQIFDEHPELEDDLCDDIMNAYKWILENLPDYYQISREEIESYYEDYEKRCKALGFTLRVSHMKKSSFYLPFDREAAQTCYQQFRTAKRDSNSDCEACEIHFDVKMALEFSGEEEALRIAQPLLDGSKHCAEVPHCTYGVLTRYYLYHGNISEARYYGKLCERMIGTEPEFLDMTGTLLELYSVIHPSHGWKLFKRNIENFVQSVNPMLRMRFALGAYRLLEKVGCETEFANSALLSSLDVKRTEDGYAVADLIAYFKNHAEDYAARLDQRNGSDYYMNQIRTQLPDEETASENLGDMVYPEHGLIERMSALFLTGSPAAPTIESIDAALQAALSDDITLISHGVDEGALFMTMQYENAVFEVALLSIEELPEMHVRPQYGVDHECYTALLQSDSKYMLRIDYSDDGLQSYHLVMYLLHTLIPELYCVVDVMAGKVYPANWVTFASVNRNAIAPRDLIGLNICGAEEDDEVWMTTRGLPLLGLRELEIAGATRENFAYFADLLHHAACQCVVDNMLPDAGTPFAEFILDESRLDITWGNPEKAVADMENALAKNIDRSIPSAMLMILPDNEDSEETATPILPTQYAPMLEGKPANYPGTHADFVRRIYLSKETFPLFAAELEKNPSRAAVRLEFEMSEEMRRKYGYGKELLWADHMRIEEGRILAEVAETSEMLPEISEGDVVTVNADIVTAWFLQPEADGDSFNEEDAFCLIG